MYGNNLRELAIHLSELQRKKYNLEIVMSHDFDFDNQDSKIEWSEGYFNDWADRIIGFIKIHNEHQELEGSPTKLQSIERILNKVERLLKEGLEFTQENESFIIILAIKDGGKRYWRYKLSHETKVI